jgi:hypothetical protein
LALAALGAGIAASTMAGDATAAPADKASLEKAVEELRAAMVAGDGNALKRLLNDRLTYSHSDAHLQNKGQVLDELAGKHAFVSIDQTKLWTDIVGNVGIARFVFDGVNPPGADGKPVPPSHIFVVQVWLRSRNAWTLLARASTPIPKA